MRHYIVALNKIDDPDAMERAFELEERFKKEGVPVHLVSALTGEGVEDVLTEVRSMLDDLPEVDYAAEAKAAEARRVKRAADGEALENFTVVDTPYAFVVEGPAIERFAQMTNWDYFESYKR